MKLESWHNNVDKHRWKLVRTDFFGPNGGDIEGEIVTADEASGECEMSIKGESETRKLSLGPHGFTAVRRAR
jgi:hypothetical protein